MKTNINLNYKNMWLEEWRTQETSFASIPKELSNTYTT